MYLPWETRLAKRKNGFRAWKRGFSSIRNLFKPVFRLCYDVIIITSLSCDLAFALHVLVHGQLKVVVVVS